MIKFIIGVIIYILIGCIIDLLITKGEQKPNLVIASLWPLFLIICFIILSIENSDKTEETKEPVKTCEYGNCSDGCQKLKNAGEHNDTE